MSNGYGLIVIGGKNSANTKHLAELSREQSVVTYHIENADELKRQLERDKMRFTNRHSKEVLTE